MGSAGGAALYIQLEVFLFPLKQIVGEQLLLHVLKAQAVYRVGKALAGAALLPEQQNGLLNHTEYLVLVGEDLL